MKKKKEIKFSAEFLSEIILRDWQPVLLRGKCLLYPSYRKHFFVQYFFSYCKFHFQTENVFRRHNSFRAYEAMQCSDSSEPDVVPFFQKRRAQYLVCGERHVTVKSGCQIFAWGSNSQGQLGDIHRTNLLRCGLVNMKCL